MKTGLAPNESIITDFHDLSSIVLVIDSNVTIHTEVNNSISREPEKSVAPILEQLYSTAEKNSKNDAMESNDDFVASIMKKLYENAKNNASKKSKYGIRHDSIIKNFAASLYCLIGKSGYEMLVTNLGCGLPSVATVQKMLRKKIQG